MLKRLILLLLEFAAGLAGNLAAGWIQQDAWRNLFTPQRLVGTAVGAALMLVVVAALESERSLAWNWRWHRLWYLRALSRDPELRRRQTEFAQLELAHGRRPLSAAEVIQAGVRRDLVALLREIVLQPGPAGGRALVLGEPGAGKTTGLEHLAVDLAQQGARRLGWGWRLPIVLRLGNYQSGQLEVFAAESLRHAPGGRSAAALSRGFATLLEQGRVILLCDALDEALGERGERVRAELDIWLSSRLYAATPLIITARAHEDPGERLPDLPAFTLQDLNDDAVDAFVHVYRQPEHNEATVRQRLAQAGLLEPGGLGRNPFWLKLVVQSGVFQGRKGQILSQAVDTLLAREWDKPATRRTDWERVLPRALQLPETRTALAWLAYQMSQAQVVVIEAERVVNEILPPWLAARHSAQGLRSADVVGLGRDAQLLDYWAGPLRFRHRLLQEALTAWFLAQNAARRAEAVARHAGDVAWWETLLMLGHLTPEPAALAATVLESGDDETTLFLAAAILQGVTQPDPALRRRLTSALARSLRQGVSDGHRAAVTALARIARDDVIDLLGAFLQAEETVVQDGAVALLRELNALPEIFLGPHIAWLSALAPALNRLERAARQPILIEFFAGQPLFLEGAAARPGTGVVRRNGVWLPDIAWGEIVPAGRYTVGGDSQASDSFPQQAIRIPQAYQLARYPITYAQFQCFIEAPDVQEARWWEGMPPTVPLGPVHEFGQQRFKFADHPRDMVTWYQAIAFGRWLSDKLGYEVDLPTEYEWEVAARYPDGRFYPWGNAFDPTKANTRASGLDSTSAVGAFPDGANSALGLYDLSGNVWEWCRNKYDDPADTRVEDNDAGRALRGGSWDLTPDFARAAYRGGDLPYLRNSFYGFRVVRRPPSQ